MFDPEDKQEIKNAKNLAQIFMTLRDYISFFNYEIVQYLIELLGSPDDQTQLREYCSALDQFCQRNVFEIPAEVFSSKSRNKTAKVLVLKCTERVATLEYVKSLTRRITEALNWSTKSSATTPLSQTRLLGAPLSHHCSCCQAYLPSVSYCTGSSQCDGGQSSHLWKYGWGDVETLLLEQ